MSLITSKPLGHLWFTFFVSFIFLAVPTEFCNGQDSFGRTVASGDWFDGNWIDDSGGSGSPPDALNIANIGSTFVSGAVAPAFVELGSTATVFELTLGNSFNSEQGSLAITSGGSLSTSTTDNGGTFVDGGILEVQSGANLSTNGIVIQQNGEVMVEGNVSTTSVYSTAGVLSIGSDLSANVEMDDSTLNVNGNLSGTVLIESSNLNFGSGMISGSLEISDFENGMASTISRTGGQFALNHLIIFGATEMDLLVGDSVDAGFIGLEQGATLNSDVPVSTRELSLSESIFNLSQADGATTGIDITGDPNFQGLLDIDATSLLNIEFDNIESAGLDWAIRLRGDQQVVLSEYLANGQINVSGVARSVDVIFDPTVYGNFTYLGYVNSVPEPSSACLIGIVAIVGTMRRRRL